jgi:hypothetical protein
MCWRGEERREEKMRGEEEGRERRGEGRRERGGLGKVGGRERERERERERRERREGEEKNERSEGGEARRVERREWREGKGGRREEGERIGTTWEGVIDGEGGLREEGVRVTGGEVGAERREGSAVVARRGQVGGLDTRGPHQLFPLLLPQKMRLLGVPLLP